MKLLTMFLNLLNVAEKGMEWHPEKALEVLPKAGIGMLVIFVIIGVIIISTLLINKIFSGKK
jgi:hypothetical protein